MDDPVIVAESYGREQLEQEGFDLGGQERLGHGVEEGFEVVLDEIKHEEDSALSSWFVRVIAV